MTQQEALEWFPLAYCASQYLKQWEGDERALFDTMKSGIVAENVQKALGYFKASRSFKGLAKGGKKRVEELFNKVVEDCSLTNEVKRVDDLADKFATEFGSRNLSAASKLFWLRYRSPYIIYDSRALAALKMLTGRSDLKNKYSNYSNVWKKTFANYDFQIKAAICALPRGKGYIPSYRCTSQQICDLAQAQWFCHRVFDKFLWELGGISPSKS